MRGSIASEHLVHLFDETRSLVDTVSGYLREGWLRGDTLLVVARANSWALTSAELEATGCPVAGLTASGRLITLDAATTLATVAVNGEPERDAFERQIGGFIRRLCRDSSAGVTAYGEMVDILAAQGNFNAAERLESFWNDLSAQCSFRLLCGYLSAHFGDQRHARHLDSICGQHTHAVARPTDLLGAWLLADRRPKFHLDA